MASFLHRLAEELRTREQYLEDHSTHPAFETEEGDTFRREYEELVSALSEFRSRITKAHEAGDDYDEHFERQVEDEHRQISVKIDAWSSKVKG